MITIRPSSLSDRRSFLGASAMGLMFALTGCDTTGAFLIPDGLVNSEFPCQVKALWHPNVIYTEDSVHRGAQLPGIAGRVYLSGSEIGRPFLGDGSLIVGLYDCTPRPGVTGPVELEEWKIDPVTLKRLAKKDVIGWGYTVFLPWNTFKPEIKQVLMKVRYDQANRASIYSESELTLDSTNATPEVQKNVKGPQGVQ